MLALPRLYMMPAIPHMPISFLSTQEAVGRGMRSCCLQPTASCVLLPHPSCCAGPWVVKAEPLRSGEEIEKETYELDTVRGMQDSGCGLLDSARGAWYAQTGRGRSRRGR